MPNSVRQQPAPGRRASTTYIPPASSDYPTDDDPAVDEINGLGVPLVDKPRLSETEREARPFAQPVKVETGTGAWPAAGWIIALAVLAAIAYYFIGPSTQTIPPSTVPAAQTQQPPAAPVPNAQPAAPQAQDGSSTAPVDPNAPLNGTVPKAN